MSLAWWQRRLTRRQEHYEPPRERPSRRPFPPPGRPDPEPREPWGTHRTGGHYVIEHGASKAEWRRLLDEISR